MTLPDSLVALLEDKLASPLSILKPESSRPCPASVLMILSCEEDQWHLLFTRRTQRVEKHKGQVSFPGGVWEDGDASLAFTALREAREEIGLEAGAVRLLGMLPSMDLATDFRVYPFVGMQLLPQKLQPCDDEVARIFRVPLEFLMLPENHEWRIWEDKNARRFIPYFRAYDGEQIWGATGIMTLKLIELLNG